MAIFKGRIFDEETSDNDEASVGEGNESMDDTTNKNDQALDKVQGTYDRNADHCPEDDEQGDLPDLDSPGIVHRSPRIEGSDVVRLVLVIDIPSDFHIEDDETNNDENVS